MKSRFLTPARRPIAGAYAPAREDVKQKGTRVYDGYGSPVVRYYSTYSTSESASELRAAEIDEHGSAGSAISMELQSGDAHPKVTDVGHLMPNRIGRTVLVSGCSKNLPRKDNGSTGGEAR